MLFGTLAWSALTLLTALSVALFGAAFPLVRRSGHPFLTAIGAAALWTSIDWLRGLWPLGGFTWGSLGVSQVANPITVRARRRGGGVRCDVRGGVRGRLLAEAASADGRRAALARVALAAAALLGPGVIPFATPPDGHRRRGDPGRLPRRRSRDVQGGRRRRRDEAQPGPSRDVEGGPSRSGRLGRERARPRVPLDHRRGAGTIADVGAPVVAGATSADIRSARPTTAACTTKPSSSTAGERWSTSTARPTSSRTASTSPGSRSSDGSPPSSRSPYELTPGERLHTLSAPGLPRFGAPICFENSFPALDRELVRQGAEFLVVLTNNASYDETAASAQHLQMSRMRAIENGRWIVHAAVSGISAFIDPGGRVYDETALFAPGVIRRTIRASSDRTWSVRLGDWLPDRLARDLPRAGAPAAGPSR